MMRTASLSLALAIVVTGCGDDSPPAPTSGGNPPPAAQEVAIHDNHFTPSSASVDVGETVRWEWNGSNEHSVTFVAVELGGSDTQMAGTYSRTFSEEGSFQYYCTIHGSPTGGMRGSVTVGDAEEPADTTTGTGY